MSQHATCRRAIQAFWASLGAWLLVALALPSAARAAVIDVVATDSAQMNIAKIEGAGAGDEVVVHPGTYKFRLYLEGAGTAGAPIVIHAADPQDRPIWDLDGDITASFPGSYDGGDSGRGIWQVTGAYYAISDIVFRHGTDGEANGSGLRFKSSDHTTLTNCLFDHNDNGIQGAGDTALVEFCEFTQNGDPTLTEGSHNLYIHGGTLTVRYSYIHDALQGQNLHIRANDAVLEYNWIARSHSYMGDMMSCTIDPCDPVQHLMLRGNVFIRGTPQNDGQEFVLYNDQGTPGKSFELTMINNTIIGNGDAAPLLHFANDTGDIGHESAVLDNNVIVDMASVFRVDDTGLGNATSSGTNNWLSAGTTGKTGLGGTVTGADPGFKDAAHDGFVPAAESPLIGAADDTVSGLPDKEYYRDETVAMMWRQRASAHDIGAFESTTKGPGIGPYGNGGGGSGAGASGAGGSSSGGAGGGGSTSSAPSGAGGNGGANGGSGGSNGSANGDSSGCGCRVDGAERRDGAALFFVAGLAALVARRRRAGARPC